MSVELQRRCRVKNIDRIEEMFRREKELRETVLERKLGGGGRTGGAPTGHSYVSDPTAVGALRLAAKLNSVALFNGYIVYQPEAWLSVIDAVKTWCGRDELRSEIYRRRYKLGESYKTSCWDLHISSSTYHFLLVEIRNYALACAAQAQVVRVF